MENRKDVGEYIVIIYRDDSKQNNYTEPPPSISLNTTKGQEVKKYLENIEYKFGGDHFEPTTRTLKFAVESTEEDALLLVFTDISSKDPELRQEIKEKAKQKNQEILFLIGGGEYGKYNMNLTETVKFYAEISKSIIVFHNATNADSIELVTRLEQFVCDKKD